MSSIIARLSQFVTPERLALLKSKLNLRTRYITIVLENVHHEQNVSAVIRTCECLGIQDLHIIENSNKLSIHSTIDRGSEKWINVFHYNQSSDNSAQCIQHLKQQGYRIVATTPHDDTQTLPPTPGFGAQFSMPERSDSLYRFDITRGPVAIVIGSERKGISKFVVDHADDFITIPMVGFTESLNLSVCAAIIASHLKHELSVHNINASIPQEQQDDILFNWLMGSIRNADLVFKRIQEQEGLC